MQQVQVQRSSVVFFNVKVFGNIKLQPPGVVFFTNRNAEIFHARQNVRLMDNEDHS